MNATTTLFVTCSTLLFALGAVILIGGLNYSSQYTVDAQLVDVEELREDLKAAIVEEKFHAEMNQNQSDLSAATSSNGLVLKLDRAHFIPLSPLSNSPGNQIKMLLDYTLDNSSAFEDDAISAVMEVYAENQTLLRTSSLPEPIVLDDYKGNIQLATTLNDPTLKNIIARALLTDGQKINPLSDPIEANLSLGEVRSEDKADLEK